MFDNFFLGKLNDKSEEWFLSLSIRISVPNTLKDQKECFLCEFGRTEVWYCTLFIGKYTVAGEEIPLTERFLDMLATESVKNWNCLLGVEKEESCKCNRPHNFSGFLQKRN